LILPGSANLIGGEAYPIKHRKMSNSRVRDMLVYTQDHEPSEKWRYMKMACGENIKQVYGYRGIMPGSRLGEGYLFRKAFQGARTLVDNQDEWCVNARGEGNVMKHSFPEDTAWDTLSALLRGHVLLHNHCYGIVVLIICRDLRFGNDGST
jgi:hypothetical protein